MTKTSTNPNSLSFSYSYKCRNQAPTLSPYHCFTLIRNENKHLSSVHIIDLLVQVTKTSTYPQSLSLIYSYKWRNQTLTLSPYLWFTRKRDEMQHLFSVLIIDLLVQVTKNIYPESLSLIFSYKWRKQAPNLIPYHSYTRTSNKIKHLPSVLIIVLLVLETETNTNPRSLSLFYSY